MAIVTADVVLPACPVCNGSEPEGFEDYDVEGRRVLVVCHQETCDNRYWVPADDALLREARFDLRLERVFIVGLVIYAILTAPFWIPYNIWINRPSACKGGGA